MTDKIIIEPFNGDQAVADAVAALHLQVRLEQQQDGTNLFEPEVTPLDDSQPDLKNMRSYYVEPGGNFWIARDRASGRIVGFVGLKRQAGTVGVLKRMAVIKEYRRRGIGRRLTETLIAWAKEHRFTEITLGTGINEKARGLYLQLGFVDTGFGKDGADYQMRLDLTCGCPGTK